MTRSRGNKNRKLDQQNKKQNSSDTDDIMIELLRRVSELEKKIDACNNFDERLKHLKMDHENFRKMQLLAIQHLQEKITSLEKNHKKCSLNESDLLECLNVEHLNAELEVLRRRETRINDMLNTAKKNMTPRIVNGFDNEQKVKTRPLSYHNRFNKDKENRTVVFVASKIIKSRGKQKAGFCIWWAEGHVENHVRFVEPDNITEDIVVLQAIVDALQTAIKCRQQKLCVISDAKFLMSRIIERFPKNPQDRLNVSEMFMERSSEEKDFYLFIYEMSTWFYDIEWIYTDAEENIFGIQDAVKELEFQLTTYNK